MAGKAAPWRRPRPILDMKMQLARRIGSAWLWMIIFALGLTVPVAAQPSPPSPREGRPPVNPQMLPQYPVPYRVPSVDAIKADLEYIRARLDAAVATRIIDRRTGEPITDLSQPHPGAMVDLGADHKFNPTQYPMGVIHAGMLLAADATGDRRFSDFTARRFQFFADDLPDLAKWGVPDGLRRSTNPFAALLRPEALDDCGAMGAAMIKARVAGVGPDLLPVIDRFAAYISHGQFRLADGTLARNRPRPDSLWADDLYMSVPFLAQMGRMTGDARYFDDAVRQVRQISARLFVPALGLYAHGWNEGNADDHPKYYWGRANGWCMMAMVELLSVLPENHPGRADVLKLLRAQAEGIANVQSGSGLWHQLLNRDDSYLESSCSAMFTFALARAVNRGWLDAPSYGPVAVAGWNGLSTRITPEGHVDGTCVGTSYADDAIYYYHRPARDDVHGYGPALLAGAEMIRLLENKELHIFGRPGSPVYFNPTFEGAEAARYATPPAKRPRE